jgi:hypothetical protein
MERYDARHDWQRCRHEDADGMGVILSVLMAKVKKTNGVSGCPDCFFFFFFCRRRFASREREMIREGTDCTNAAGVDVNTMGW